MTLNTPSEELARLFVDELGFARRSLWTSATVDQGVLATDIARRACGLYARLLPYQTMAAARANPTQSPESVAVGLLTTLSDGYAIKTRRVPVAERYRRAIPTTDDMRRMVTEGNLQTWLREHGLELPHDLRPGDITAADDESHGEHIDDDDEIRQLTSALIRTTTAYEGLSRQTGDSRAKALAQGRNHFPLLIAQTRFTVSWACHMEPAVAAMAIAWTHVCHGLFVLAWQDEPIDIESLVTELTVGEDVQEYLQKSDLKLPELLVLHGD